VTDEFVWLTYPAHGGFWKCPIGALGLWTARGWEQCDPPVEPDITKDPAVLAAMAEQAAADEAAAEKPAKTTAKSKRADAAAITEEGAE
jgi:hypothetical protein